MTASRCTAFSSKSRTIKGFSWHRVGALISALAKIKEQGAIRPSKQTSQLYTAYVGQAGKSNENVCLMRPEGSPQTFNLSSDCGKRQNIYLCTCHYSASNPLLVPRNTA